jgi:hypothetical protein
MNGLAGDPGEPTRRHASESNPDHQGARRARSSGPCHSDAPGRSRSVTRRREASRWRRQPRAMTRRGFVARHEHATSRAPRPPMTHTRSGRAPTRARECRSRSHRRDVAPADSPRRRSQPPAGAESARPMTRCPPTGRSPLRPEAARAPAVGIARRVARQQADAGPADVGRRWRLRQGRARRHAAGGGWCRRRRRSGPIATHAGRLRGL